MKEPRDSFVGGLQRVVLLHGLLRLEDVVFYARLVEPVEGFGLHLEALVHAAGKDHD